MPSREKERRTRPRVQVGLAAQLSDESGATGLAAETVNVSVAGVCCRVARPVEPLTRVKITLLVPDVKSKKHAKSAVVSTEGVVVRTELLESEAGKETYEIACAFTGLKDKDLKIMQSYVDSRLDQTAPSSKGRGSQGAGTKPAS